MKRFSLILLSCLLPATAILAAGTHAPLADATEKLDRATALSLLAEPVDVNASQADGMTALHWAAYHDDLDLVHRLLEAGADATAASRYGVTPLALACTNGNGTMAERLLDAGADANATLPGGETVLMTAARTGRLGAIRALLSHGADLHAREGKRGQTAMMWAAAEGHVDIVKLFVELGADFRRPLESGFTPLLFAAREGRSEVVMALLEAGADVNGTVQEVVKEKKPYRTGGGVIVGAAPLLVAVTNAHWELAAKLLEAGADPNSAETGYTALHMVSKVRKPGVGDNNPAPDGSGQMSSLDFVRDIASHGADLDARMTEKRRVHAHSFGELGATPFLLAAVTADAELMRTLVELGADPLARNDNDSTALMAAAGLGTRSPGEDAGTEEEVLEALQLALELGIDVNTVNAKGETAMHGAAYKNYPRAVEFLASRGADIEIWNRRNDYGWTPLTIARGYRVGNFKPSPVTEAAVTELMIAANVHVPTVEEEGAKHFDIYAKKPEPAADADPAADKDKANPPP